MKYTVRRALIIRFLRSIPTEIFWGALLLIGLGLASRAVWAQNVPECFGSVQELQESVARQGVISEEQLLARLIYAESLSARIDDLEACQADSRAYRELLAWGVRGRWETQRFGKSLTEVVFKPGQFRPAVSERSEFSRAFRCPQGDRFWVESFELARQVWRADSAQSPFGSRKVTHFYYPFSNQANEVPPRWARSKENRVFPLRLRGRSLVGGCVWFFYELAPRRVDVP